jgi:hypothetical protein
VRKQKRIAFAAVGDGSTINSLQAVLKPEDATKYQDVVNAEDCSLTTFADSRTVQPSD